MPIAGAQKAIAVSSVPKKRLGIDESFDFMGVILSGIHLSHDRRQLAIPHERYAAEAASQPSAKADASRSTVPGLLPGRLMVIRQARGRPKSRGESAARVLGDFVDKVWGHSFIADAMRRHDIESASVAPAATIQITVMQVVFSQCHDLSNMLICSFAALFSNGYLR